MLAFFNRLPFKTAALVGVLAGYLLLPEAFGIDLPGLPPIKKSSVLALGLLLGLWFANQSTGSRSNMGAEATVERFRFLDVLLLGAIGLLIINSFLTVVTNREPISYGALVLPPLSFRDVISATSGTVFAVIPFLVARKYFSQPLDHRLILKLFVAAALAYSVLILVELRISPQLHRLFYGFHQHSFVQHVRSGYRPMVFLDHGLSVGFLLFSACVAAGALFASAAPQKKTKRLLVFVFFCVLLVISRNLGATALALVFVPLLWFGRRIQLWSITLISVLFLTYPAVRQADVLPTDQLVALATSISEDRAASLQHRFNNEDILLAHALEKPFFGWGGWNRSRVFNADGRDVSTTDGLWVIRLGTGGWIGYTCFFGLLCFPLLLLSRARKRKEIPIETIALGLIMVGNLVYLIPNSTLSPLAWVFAGALAGFVQYDAKSKEASTQSVDSDPQERSAINSYTRFAKGAKTPDTGVSKTSRFDRSVLK